MIDTISSKIEELLAKGMRLSKEHIHFIDSTFSNPPLHRIVEILEGNSREDADTLSQFLFFPDESFQIALEPFIAGLHPDREVEAGIIRRIQERRPKTRIVFPKTDTAQENALELRMPGSVAGFFVSRLNLTYVPNLRLAESIEAGYAKEDANRIRVALRNLKVEGSASVIDFLSLFFEKMNEPADILLKRLEIVCDIVDTRDTEGNFYTLFANKKRRYVQLLENITESEGKRKNSNMETLMIMGVRKPYVDIGDLLFRIETIDRVTLALYKKMEWIELPLTEIHEVMKPRIS